ncbi:MAG: hypothetical protein IR164_04935 [Devosia sp.]|uniref:hypothetical protein n=1 Tax=Devosia sp. TaxID=1871048 RepID=UPI0019FDE8C6|nr:hypothetical protein [Devosia sp.]MBF0678268.1 hypothetical protein [Devosia sp.]
MRRAALASALLFTACGPALAQNLDAFTSALRHAPEALLVQPARVQFSFVDIWALKALADLEGMTLGADGLLRTQLGYELRPIAALHAGGVAAWEAKSRVPLDQLGSVSGFGSIPDNVAIWSLADDTSANSLRDALVADGFAPVGEQGALGNGTPMVPDLRNRDPSNPWRSAVGAASFVMTHGNAVVQAARPEVLPILLDGQRSVAENTIVATALTGLEQSAGDGWIVQAMVISPAFGAGRVDFSSFTVPDGGSSAQMREKIEASLEASAKGIPFYLGGVIADVQLDGPGVAIALVYPDCTTAGAAAEAIAKRWVETMPETAQGKMTVTSGDSVNGLCSALVTVFGSSEASSVNPIFKALFEMDIRGQFSVLQIGAVD